MEAISEPSVLRADSETLIDGCGRRIDHLRLSVTSHCDLNCLYCRPSREDSRESDRNLTDQQRVEFVRFLHHRFGLAQVRITGGEPLLYKRTVPLVHELKTTLPSIELAVTTNGRLLYQRGFDLRQAGLDRINVSLDSIRPERYRRITGSDIDCVLAGIESALLVGFTRLKINTVVLRGLNDDEINELAAWALSRSCEIRFLEAMPIGPAAGFNRQAFVSGSEIKAKLARTFRLDPLPTVSGGTARRFRATSDKCEGTIGLITPVSEPFCNSCRRMRLTAGGRLYPCLLDNRSIDISSAWRDGRLRQSDCETMIHCAVEGKNRFGTTQAVPMIQLGG